MICVGIDVAKDKHDCFILSSEGEILADVFTIPNNAEGFDTLLQTIRRCARPEDKIKVGLEATGHYSYNILGFLLNKGLPTFVINPLHTNLYRKSLSLRKTKTDRVDARTIAAMLMSDVDLKSYTDTAYHNEELKSLTRYRFDKVRERAKLKQSVSRLVTILFPELEKLVPTLHMASVYALLSEFPGAKQVAGAHLTHLKTVLSDASKGRYGRDMATTLRDTARCSIGSVMPAKSLELRHTIRLIRELDAEIEDIETAIQSIMYEIQSPITTIPGIGVRMGAMILAEIGDFSRFDSPDKILAYAGMSPSTYQSGQLSRSGAYSHMEKTRFPLFALRALQCHQIRLSLGPNLRRLPVQEASRGKTLQCCALSRGKEVGAFDLRYGEVSAVIPQRRLTYFMLSLASIWTSALLCSFEPSTFFHHSSHFRLDI